MMHLDHAAIGITHSISNRCELRPRRALAGCGATVGGEVLDSTSGGEAEGASTQAILHYHADLLQLVGSRTFEMVTTAAPHDIAAQH